MHVDLNILKERYRGMSDDELTQTAESVSLTAAAKGMLLV